MRVLCVVAHPDDEVLGVGGTLARHAARGDEVHVCILSDGVTSRHETADEAVTAQVERRADRARRATDLLGVASTTFHRFPDNQFDAVPLLDVVKAVEAEVTSVDPGVVYTHHHGDLNVDHEHTCRAVTTACRPLPESTVDRVFTFETLSSTEWTVPGPNTLFQPRHFVDVSEHLETKLDALSVYEDELREPPHPRSLDTVRRNAEVWGAKVGLAAAEPFGVLRTLWR